MEVIDLKKGLCERLMNLMVVLVVKKYKWFWLFDLFWKLYKIVFLFYRGFGIFMFKINLNRCVWF